MASRTSAGVGMMVTLAIFIVLSLSLFVTTIVFFAKVQRLNNDLRTKQADLDAAVRSDERDDRWEELKTMAGGTGVVRFLDTSLREAARLVSGSARDQPAQLVEKIKKAQGDSGQALLAMLSSRDGQIANLEKALKGADEARLAAQADLQASVDRMSKLEAEHRDTVAKLNAEVDAYKSNAERYGAGVETTTSAMIERVDQQKRECDAQIASLEGQVSSLEGQLLVANDQLRKLRVGRTEESLRPNNEAALVDGHVVGVNAAAKQVYLDLGRRDRLVLGMTFEVYPNASVIRPGPGGEYPAGKGSLEIIRIDDTSSVARIVRETAGSPIVNGDVIANAVYDPKKVYTFTVYGNFDTTGDGIPTPQGASDIRALIASWGGVVNDDISGDTDFVVLGSKPILPPQPKPTDPVELIQRYLLLKQAAQKYDQLFEKASQTGIPVLNQNRLYTLIGGRPQK